MRSRSRGRRHGLVRRGQGQGNVARLFAHRELHCADARIRLKTARAYLEVAELVLGERERDEYLNVAAGLAVLAGIAASDSICCARLRSRHRGDDHRGAADLLRTATPDGASLAKTFLRLLDLKDEAHYGVMVVAAQGARRRPMGGNSSRPRRARDRTLRPGRDRGAVSHNRPAGHRL